MGKTAGRPLRDIKENSRPCTRSGRILANDTGYRHFVRHCTVGVWAVPSDCNRMMKRLRTVDSAKAFDRSPAAMSPALIVTLHPERFKAVVMHSGIPPVTAHPG
jgi:hypothetical protein